MGATYLVVRADLPKHQLALHWHDEQGQPLATFTALEAHLVRLGRKLLFAANSGIFEPSD